MALQLPRLGFRREAQVLLPAALLLLIGLSTFTLFSYRSAIQRLSEERREYAAEMARDIASQLGARAPSEAELRRKMSGADGLAVIGPSGEPLLELGLSASPLPFDASAIERPSGFGPSEVTGTVVGISPFGPTDERLLLRVDLQAATLLAQARSLPLLLLLVLGVNLGLLLLVVLYLRHLLRPLDAILESARALRGEDAHEAADDDVELLLDTFERAVDALRERSSPFEDDVAALQRTLATGLESGLLVLDSEGTLLSINPAGSELLHLDAESAASVHYSELMEEGDELRATLDGALASGQGVQRKECSLERGGRTLRLGLTLHPLKREDHAIRGWLGLFADLTEVHRRSEEERLSESLEQIGALTAGLAHELRNGLASLRGYLTLLERGAAADEPGDLTEDLAEMRHEADHLQRVVEDFLSFARPGSVRIESIELERLLHRAASDPALARASVVVRRETECPPIQGDPQLLERAIRNLLHNAVRAQAEGRAPDGAVQVRLSADTEGATVRVEDEGPGIDPALEGRLFHPFASASPQGVGLGLALSRRIAELHGGTIRLENRPEAGACAVLFLPRDRFVTEGNDTVPLAAP